MNGKRASAHGKVVAAAEAMLGGRWVAATSGRALSHVIPHRHTHTHKRTHTLRERATYFISCKCPRKYEHYIPETEAAAFARKRQAGRQHGGGGRGAARQTETGRTFGLQELPQGAKAEAATEAALIKVGKQLKPLLDRTPDYNNNYSNNWDDYDVFTSCRKCRAGQVGGPCLVLPAPSRK